MEVLYGKWKREVNAKGMVISNLSSVSEWMVTVSVDGKPFVRKYLPKGETLIIPLPIKGEVSVDAMSEDVAVTLF